MQKTLPLSAKTQKVKDGLEIKTDAPLTENKGKSPQKSELVDKSGRIVATFTKKDDHLEMAATQDAQESGDFEKAAKKLKIKKEDIKVTTPGKEVEQMESDPEREDEDHDSEKMKLTKGAYKGSDIDLEHDKPMHPSTLNAYGLLNDPHTVKKQVGLHQEAAKKQQVAGNKMGAAHHNEMAKIISDHASGVKKYAPPTYNLDTSKMEKAMPVAKPAMPEKPMHPSEMHEQGLLENRDASKTQIKLHNQESRKHMMAGNKEGATHHQEMAKIIGDHITGIKKYSVPHFDLDVKKSEVSKSSLADKLACMKAKAQKAPDQLEKAYSSDAQRRWAHTEKGTEALGGPSAVKEWDQKSKGKKLPEKVAKATSDLQLNPEGTAAMKQQMTNPSQNAGKNFQAAVSQAGSALSSAGSSVMGAGKAAFGAMGLSKSDSKKPIHEMTRSEYESAHGKPKKNTTVTGGHSAHKSAIETALNRGISVPSHVLADYPDLKPKDGLKKADEQKSSVIGKTKSGKDIHLDAEHPSHNEFDKKDHMEAGSLHRKMSRSTEGHKKAIHQRMANTHYSMATGEQLDSKPYNSFSESHGLKKADEDKKVLMFRAAKKKNDKPIEAPSGDHEDRLHQIRGNISRVSELMHGLRNLSNKPKETKKEAPSGAAPSAADKMREMHGLKPVPSKAGMSTKEKIEEALAGQKDTNPYAEKHFSPNQISRHTGAPIDERYQKAKERQMETRESSGSDDEPKVSAADKLKERIAGAERKKHENQLSDAAMALYHHVHGPQMAKINDDFKEAHAAKHSAKDWQEAHKDDYRPAGKSDKIERVGENDTHKFFYYNDHKVAADKKTGKTFLIPEQPGYFHLINSEEDENGDWHDKIMPPEEAKEGYLRWLANKRGAKTASALVERMPEVMALRGKKAKEAPPVNPKDFEKPRLGTYLSAQGEEPSVRQKHGERGEVGKRYDFKYNKDTHTFHPGGYVYSEHPEAAHVFEHVIKPHLPEHLKTAQFVPKQEEPEKDNLLRIVKSERLKKDIIDFKSRMKKPQENQPIIETKQKTPEEVKAYNKALHAEQHILPKRDYTVAPITESGVDNISRPIQDSSRLVEEIAPEFEHNRGQFHSHGKAADEILVKIHALKQGNLNPEQDPQIAALKEKALKHDEIAEKHRQANFNILANLPVHASNLMHMKFKHLNRKAFEPAQEAIHRPFVEKGGLHLIPTVKKSSEPLKKDLLPGGKGDNKKDSDFDKREVSMGHKVETEHTKNPKIAAEITRDHLVENPKYYDKLKDAGLADELEKAKKWEVPGLVPPKGFPMKVEKASPALKAPKAPEQPKAPSNRIAEALAGRAKQNGAPVGFVTPTNKIPQANFDYEQHKSLQPIDLHEMADEFGKKKARSDLNLTSLKALHQKHRDAGANDQANRIRMAYENQKENAENYKTQESLFRTAGQKSPAAVQVQLEAQQKKVK